MLPVGKTARALARANILVRDHEGPRLVEVKALTSVKNVHIGEVLGEWVGVALRRVSFEPPECDIRRAACKSSRKNPGRSNTQDGSVACSY